MLLPCSVDILHWHHREMCKRQSNIMLQKCRCKIHFHFMKYLCLKVFSILTLAASHVIDSETNRLSCVQNWIVFIYKQNTIQKQNCISLMACLCIQTWHFTVNDSYVTCLLVKLVIRLSAIFCHHNPRGSTFITLTPETYSLCKCSHKCFTNTLQALLFLLFWSGNNP